MREHDAIYIRTAKERRPFIIEHPDTLVYSKANAHELQHWYDHGGKEAMLYYLMHEAAQAAEKAAAAKDRLIARRKDEPPTADKALAAPLPGLAGPGGKPNKGCDLSTVERAEFRQFGAQGP